MKVQREGRRVINLPGRLAERLIAKGNFKTAEEVKKPPKKVKKPPKKKK